LLAGWGSRFRALSAVALAVTLSFGVATFVRARAWADEIEFWSVTFHQHPEERSMSAVALGSMFSREGSFDRALGLFRLGSEPGMDCEELARNDIATVLLDTGQYAAAARVLNALANQYPKTSSTFVNLALADSYLGQFEAARAALDRTLELAPSDSAARALRDRLPALAALRRELDSRPPSEPAERAQLEANLGLSREALGSYWIAIRASNVTPTLAEEASWLALRKGDVATRAAFLARYAEVAGQHVDARLQLAYDVHRDTLAKLESAWGTLGLSAAGGG
jgi:tetratricopeptide (TPR) repeat protein